MRGLKLRRVFATKQNELVGMDLFCRWPERIQTDQGGEFTGKVLKGITKAARVKRSTTTPYHPQANGQVERTNKTIAQMLSKRCYTHQRI
jgi:transposase InsO family protein